MVLLRSLVPILAGTITLVAQHAFAIPPPEDLSSWVEKRDGLKNINTTVDERGLASCLASLCCFTSKPNEPEPTPMVWVCPGDWPTLDDLKAKIQQQGNVGRQISFFYSGLGGGGAIKMAGQWASCHTNYVPANPGFVAWDRIVDNDWYLAQANSLAQVFGGLSKIDPFQKLLSQAFAEQTVGDVYVFTPTGYNVNNPSPGANTKVAWVGWEYPALTRNPNVGTIYRVDPRPGFDNERYVLWKQGDGPSPNEPLGLYNAPPPP